MMTKLNYGKKTLDAFSDPNPTPPKHDLAWIWEKKFEMSSDKIVLLAMVYCAEIGEEVVRDGRMMGLTGLAREVSYRALRRLHIAGYLDAHRDNRNTKESFSLKSLDDDSNQE